MEKSSSKGKDRTKDVPATAIVLPTFQKDPLLTKTEYKIRAQNRTYVYVRFWASLTFFALQSFPFRSFPPIAFCEFGSDESRCEEPPLPPTTGGNSRYYVFLTPSYFRPFTFFEYGSRLAQMLGITRSRLTTSYKIWVLLGSLPRLTMQMDRYGP